MTAIRKEEEVNQDQRETTAHLKVVRGGLHHKSIRENRIEQFWVFCHSTLWNTEEFTEAEVYNFKKLIADHFKNNRNTNKIFTQLIQRVCLVKRYVSRQSGRYVAKPVDWLNIQYKYGLATTQRWYEQLEEDRKKVPHYNEGISKLANAVLQYCDKENYEAVAINRKTLIEQKQYDLVQVYMNTILRLHFKF